MFSILDIELNYGSRGRMVTPSKPPLFGISCNYSWSPKGSVSKSTGYVVSVSGYQKKSA